MWDRYEFVWTRVMSLHKSKGLTLVVVAGCVGGLIPTIDYDIPENDRELQLCEQRRLF